MTTALRIYRRSELQAVDDGCLHRFRKIWIEGIDDTSDLAMVGIAFHKIQHRYILRLVEKQIPQDFEEARDAFTEGIAAARTPSRLIPEVRHVWDWHIEHWELQLDRFVAAEERQETGGIGWAPDLVYATPEELEIPDFKSGWAPPPTEDELRGDFQARVYSFYAMQRWPNFNRYRFTIHNVRFNKIVSVVFKPSELDTVERELAAHIATIQAAEAANHWPAVAGPACRFCELACPLVDTLEKVPVRLLEAQQAAIVGGWLLSAQQMIKQAKKALKGYVAGHGPINVHGVVWDNRPVVSRTYPAAQVIRALEKVATAGGLDPTEDTALTFSHSSLEKLFKQFPQILAELVPLATEKSSYRFGAKKTGMPDGGDDD